MGGGATEGHLEGHHYPVQLMHSITVRLYSTVVLTYVSYENKNCYDKMVL